MSVIDTRLAEIQVLQQRFLEVKDVYPDIAIQMSRQMEGLQKTLARDMAPLYELISKSSILS